MPGVRGLTILVLGPDRDRFRAALTLACAAAALGARTRLHLHESAAALIGPDGERPDDLIATAVELGVAFSVCQTGLAAAGLEESALVVRAEAGGLVSLLASLGDDRLVTI